MKRRKWTKQERKQIYDKCDENCIVHKLVTHNTCLFCPL